MSETVTLPKKEYDILRNKADLFDHFVETEELSNEELLNIKNALSGPLLTKSEFLRRHKDLD